MKFKGLWKDVTGFFRVNKLRKNAIKNASSSEEYFDPIAEVAKELHPESLDLVVTKIEEEPHAKKITFERADGKKLPPFDAGQYVSLALKIGDTLTTRPYSVCSAPFEARLEKHPHISICVVRKEEGFASKFLCDSISIGDHFSAAFPLGFFYFEPLRDCKKVVALAGGSGITPFLSMAKEIRHGTLDMDLTILYGSSSPSLLLKRELEDCVCDSVRLIPVVSNDPDYDGEKGFLDREKIRRYSQGEVSYFVCGPQAMYEFVEQELKALNVPAKRIRMETFGSPKDIAKEEGYPQGEEEKSFTLTVYRGVHKDEIPAKASEPILVALERAGIPSNSHCRSGECGFCRCELLSGSVFVPKKGDGRRYSDKTYGYVHACSAYPLSDLEIRIAIK